jgi:UDP-2,3-diacylglucosamine pyrophosphatase LpxH
VCLAVTHRALLRGGMKRIIISDIHIGSKFYKSSELISFLKDIKYDQLILAGDIIDFVKVPIFSDRAIEIVNAIDFSKDIIYIVGNHDTPLQGFVGKKAFGMKFVSKYEFEEGGRRFRIEHGDSFDKTVGVQNSIFMSFLSVSQNLLENWFNVNLTDWVTTWKKQRRNMRNIWDILSKNIDVDVFICGHFHIPEAIIWIDEKQRVKSYMNSGDWVSHSSFITIEDGRAKIHSYKPGVKLEDLPPSYCI